MALQGRSETLVIAAEEVGEMTFCLYRTSVRTALYEAANVMLTRTTRFSSLKR